jgi:hypothetical protein
MKKQSDRTSSHPQSLEVMNNESRKNSDYIRAKVIKNYPEKL